MKYVTLFYDDITFSKSYYPSSGNSGKISFEYDNLNRINKVIGGLISISDSDSLVNWILEDEVKDNISYENNIVKVECSYNTYSAPYNKEFVIKNDKIISRAVVRIYPQKLSSITYTYEYLDDQIIEKRNGNSFRTFTITNGNLTKVEQINYGYPDGKIIGKTEYIFSGYDNTENLLKGKFYINGAFFNAFSNNNYRKREINYYTYTDSQFVLNNYSFLGFDFGYDSSNISTLFEYLK